MLPVLFPGKAEYSEENSLNNNRQNEIRYDISHVIEKAFLENLTNLSGRHVVIDDRVVTFSPGCVVQDDQYDMLNISSHIFAYTRPPNTRLTVLAVHAYKTAIPPAFPPSFLRRVKP